MPLDWLDPHFSASAAIPALALMAYLAVAAPLRVRRAYANLSATRGRDPGALTSYYRALAGSGWAKVAVVAGVLLLGSRVGAADLGLALPSGRQGWFAVGLTVYVVAVLGVGGVRSRQRVLRGDRILLCRAARAMLPATAGERRLALAVAVTAGVSEELVFRGLAIAVGVGVFGLSPYVAAALALVFFAVNHRYQGPLGLACSTLVGALLTLLYLLSGSLLLPIVAHVFQDLVALLFVPAPPAGTGPAAPPAPATDGSPPLRSAIPRSSAGAAPGW